jgi:enoyl-CoA hydratase
MAAKALYEKRNHVFYITINRPEVHNCVDPETAALLSDAWRTFRDDDDAFVAVITGAGDKAFCSGADLKAVSEGWTGPEALSEDRFRVQLQNLGGFMGYTLGTDIYKPMIAAVNGYCFAGGVEIACMCDFRIAADHAEFGILNRRWNVGLGDGGTQRLWRIVGLGRALELIITGRRIGVEEAERIGLVNEIVPRPRLMARVTEVAEQICQLPQGSIRSDKEALMRGIGRPLEEGLRIEAEMMRVLMLRRDSMAEGARAFIEKRRPDWKQHGL